jgi:uncharacterized protein
METYTTNVLLDILFLCFVSVGIALPLYHFIRKLHPELAWHEHGSIRTSSFQNLDLLGIFIASLIFTSSVIMSGSQSEIDTTKVNNITGIQMFIIGLLNQAIPVGIACLFLMPRMDVLEIFNLNRPQIKKVIITSLLGLLAIYFSAGIATIIITPLLENNLGKQEFQAPVQMMLEAKQNNPSLLVALVILAVIVAPICEEFVFRGYIYGTLKRFSCRFFAATISALFFAVVHTSLWSVVPLFIVGFFLALIYEISGSLWAAIFTHALFNGITTFTLIFVYNESNLPY